MKFQLFPGIVGVVLGLVVTFFGYRLLKFTLVVAGFALGAYLGGLVASRAGAGNWLIIAAGVVLGVVAGLVTVWLFKLSVFLLGAVAGALIALVFAGSAVGTQLLVLAVGALAGGIAALVIQRPVLSLLTAFVGAWWLVAGLFSIFGISRLRLGNGAEMPVMALLWLGLGGAGFLVQLFLTGRKGAQRR